MRLDNFFLNERYTGVLFLKSLLIGVVIWSSCYIITPVNTVNPLSSEVVLFILLNYLALISGYFFINTIFKKEQCINKIFKVRDSSNLLYIYIILVCFSIVIRYFDLFFVREVSFFNSISTNKFNVSKESSFSLILGLLSIFRLFYFVPYLFYLVEKINKKNLLFICLFLFLVPIIEGYLRGSRRLVFESIGILVSITCIYNFSVFFSKKLILIVISGLILFTLFSNLVLKDRVKENEREVFLKETYKAPYNDLLPLNQKAKKYIDRNSDNWMGKTYFNAVHFGQYITHGVYEFDYLLKKETERKWGLYNGFILVKLLNKLKFLNIPLESLMNPTGRVTYITFFGGQFLDFGWFSLIVMFLYGGIQNRFFVVSLKTIYFKPLVIIFVFTNIFLLTFNFMRAQMLVFILSYLFITQIILILKKSKLFL